MINNSTSNCKNCMVLMQLLVAESMYWNVRVFAKHVGTKQNGKADALSRLDFDRFIRVGGDVMNEVATPIPEAIWPLRKIWKV